MSPDDRWDSEKYSEYRRLKGSGYTDKMLIEHFGEDIFHSGIYNRKSSMMPWLEFLTEITITPEHTDYRLSKKSSDIYPNKFDYVIHFVNKGVDYIISLFYYVINNIETYNILLTTKNQWDDYEKKLDELRYKGHITDEERNELVDIVEKETGLNHLYPVMKKISYILFDLLERHLGGVIISLGETRKMVKINLYRNIIKNSFPNVSEIGEGFDDVGNKYYLYRVEKK